MRKILLIAFACLLIDCVASPTRSNVGSVHQRFVPQETGNAWYVTDGLVAMYDGIYNAGMGLHDDMLNGWVDLVNGNDAVDSGYGGTFEIYDDHYIFNLGALNGAGRGVLKANIGEIVVYHIEAVYDVIRGGRIDDQGQYIDDNSCASLGLCMFGNRQFMLDNNGNGTGNVACGYGYSQYVYYGDGPFVPRTYAATMTGGWPVLSAIYVNGVAYTAFSSGQWAGNIQPYETGRLFIGYRWFTHLPKVRVFCIRLYGRKLTALEVKVNHSVDVARFGL